MWEGYAFRRTTSPITKSPLDACLERATALTWPSVPAKHQTLLHAEKSLRKRASRERNALFNFLTSQTPTATSPAAFLSSSPLPAFCPEQVSVVDAVEAAPASPPLAAQYAHFRVLPPEDSAAGERAGFPESPGDYFLAGYLVAPQAGGHYAREVPSNDSAVYDSALAD